MSEKYFAIVLLVVGCIWGYAVTKSPPTVQPAPEVMKTTSTPIELHDAGTFVGVLSLDKTGSGESLTNEDATYALRKPEALQVVRTVCELPANQPPQPSPPARSAVTAKGRTYSQPVYQMPRRRLFGRFRR